MTSSFSPVSTHTAKKESNNPLSGKENNPAKRVSGALAPPTISQNPDPYSNTGGNSRKNTALPPASNHGKQISYEQEKALRKRYAASQKRNEAVIIDWLTFVIPQSSVHPDCAEMEADELILWLSESLSIVLGYGIADPMRHGRYNYDKAWILGRKGWGFVATGGNGGGICVSISGSGLMAAREGFEIRLHNFLLRARGKITRIDFAMDLWNGEYTPRDCLADYENDKFMAVGRPPSFEQRGNWIREDGKGISAYIGHRRNGKSMVVYEKGKQLGDSQSVWCRVEARLGSRDRVIELDCLLSPTKRFVDMYKPLAALCKGVKACRLKTKTKVSEAAFSHAVNWIKKQTGRYLRCFRHMLSDEKIFELLQSSNPEPPDAMRVPSFYDSMPPIHLGRQQSDAVFA